MTYDVFGGMLNLTLIYLSQGGMWARSPIVLFMQKFAVHAHWRSHCDVIYLYGKHCGFCYIIASALS